MAVNKTIWIVEDDAGAIFVYEDILKLKYRIRFFRELKLFIEALRTGSSAPDMVITDLMLGEESFLEFLASEDSAELLTMPFIVVSSVDDLDILRLCFDGGAVEYLTKPFKKNELIVKTERLLKSGQPTLIHQIPEDEPIIIDAIARSVKRGQIAEITLTTRQLQIFDLLERARQKGLVVPRKDLEREIWGTVNVTDKTLDVHMFHLRKRLKGLGMQIIYSPRTGYKLELIYDPKE